MHFRLHIIVSAVGIALLSAAATQSVKGFESNPANTQINDLGGISQIAQDYYSKGGEEQKESNWDAALANYSKAIESDPNFADAYGCRAYVEEGEGKFDAALADYNKALELEPDWGDAYIYRGYVKQLKNNLNGALEDYDKAIEIESNIPQTYTYRAEIEQRQSNWDGAITDYGKAIQIKPDWTGLYADRLAQLYAYRGYLEAQKNDLAKALADCNKAIQFKPDWANEYGYRGELEWTNGDLQDAEADSAEAAKLDASLATNAARAFCLLGWSRYMRMEYTNSLVDFRKSSEFDPSNDYAYFGVWLCVSQLGNSEKAISELKAYMGTRKISDSGDWPSEVGRFLTGQITEKELLKAAENENARKDKMQHGEGYFYIGSKRLIAGDRAGAVACFKKCLATGAQNLAEYRSAKAELQFLENPN